ncbi:hypothetical protein INR49_007468 [Caranx melampygus]|nr:hypothetical protein INR49_007468 [Caranx melampygus]
MGCGYAKLTASGYANLIDMNGTSETHRFMFQPGPRLSVGLPAAPVLGSSITTSRSVVTSQVRAPHVTVLTFDSWPTDAVRVREVQRVSVSSSCDSQVCSSTFYSLSYGDAKTGLIPVSASAQVMEAALNHLWSIRPDKVQVTKQDDAQGSHYTVTFNSDRGDFDLLHYEVYGADTNITVVEVTKGRGNMETFTLVWGGIPTKPIAYNATEAEVQSALEDMMTAECPAEIQTSEGTAVKYFQDFEGDDSEFDGGEVGTAVKHFGFCGLWSLKNPQVLFKDSFKSESGEAYGAVSLDQHSMGMLKNEVGMKFKYRDVDGKTKTETAKISTVFTQSSSWSYKCLDLQSLLQTDYIGSGYELLELYLYRDASGDDFYVDAVHIGKRATTSDERAVPLRRRPPPFEHSRRSFESLSVSRNASAAPQIRYQIRARPMDCAFGFPLLRVAFLQMSISSEDATEFTAGATNVTVTRLHRATPPLNGTFDVEIYGARAEGNVAHGDSNDVSDLHLNNF